MSRVLCALFVFLALITSRAEGQPPNQPPPNQPPDRFSRDIRDPEVLKQLSEERLRRDPGALSGFSKWREEPPPLAQQLRTAMSKRWVIYGLIAVGAQTLRGVTLGLKALVAAIGGAMAGRKDDQEDVGRSYERRLFHIRPWL